MPTRAKFPRELMLLFSHRMLLRVGLVGFSAFVMVRMYEYFNSSIMHVALVFAALNILVVVFTPISARLISTLGIKTLLITAAPLAAVGVYSLTFIETFPLYAIIVYVLATVAYKVLYWVPYQVDFSHNLSESSRGRQVALLQNVGDVVAAAMPLLGGFLIARIGYDMSFTVAASIMLLGVLPLFWTKPTYEKYSWSFIETFRRLFAVRNRTLLAAYMGDGAQGVALTLSWVLFIFVLVEGSYEALGIISALTLLVILLLRSVTGSLYDRWDKRKVLLISTIVATTGWFVKLFVATPVQVFMSDTYHGFGRAPRKTAVEAITYEQAADNGRYVDEYTALKEMALSLGRAIMTLIIAGVAWLFGFEVTVVVSIVIAMIATLSSIYLAHKIALA